MVWAFVIVLVLLIPLLAIIIDSQVGQALADRISGGRGSEEVRPRLEALEAEVRYLTETVESLQEETRFVRSLVERRGEEVGRLEPGGERSAEERPERPSSGEGG